MCKFKSGIITKNGVTLAPMYNDSHSSLLESMGIADNQMNAMKVFVRAELVPPNNDKTVDIKSWKYRVDQDIVPDWYEEDSKRYEEEMREAVADWMKEHFVTICGKSCVKIKEDEKGSYYMLADTLFESSFGSNNNYSTSDIRKELQECDFANELRKEYGDKLVPITTNLLSLDGFDDYGKFIDRYSKIFTKFRNNHYGYPIEMTNDEWNDVLDKMIYHLRYMDEVTVAKELEKDVPEGWTASYKTVHKIMERHKDEFFKLFSEHFYSLWE